MIFPKKISWWWARDFAVLRCFLEGVLEKAGDSRGVLAGKTWCDVW
jgi:hypothetical protein